VSAIPGPAVAFTHEVAIRYGECDRQGVVFNANYLAYVDDAMDHWMRSHSDQAWVSTWDVMLKAARIVWHGPASWPEELAVDCAVARWGRTSFDVVYGLRVGERPVAEVLVTYVSVGAGTQAPEPPPAEVVAAMGPAVGIPAGLADRRP
jgi:acyl-CoA thioester hydrolase